MSLNKTLDRLFNEIRREARRNPQFADRLDAAMRAHASLRDVPEEIIAEVSREPRPPASSRQRRRHAGKPPAVEAPPPPPLNPVGLLQREGADALETALARFDRAALLALVAEHNLDPSGEAAGFDRDALAAHVIAAAAARVERDKKLFDY
jgi:hypothetical protein